MYWEKKNTSFFPTAGKRKEPHWTAHESRREWMVKDWEDANLTVTRIRTRWISSKRDGGGQERGVWCYANGSLVLLLRWAALAQETMSEKEKQKAVLLQKQGRRRSETAPHARLLILTAHQESGINQIIAPNPHHLHYIAAFCSLNATNMKFVEIHKILQMLPLGVYYGLVLSFCCSVDGSGQGCSGEPVHLNSILMR